MNFEPHKAYTPNFSFQDDGTGLNHICGCNIIQYHVDPKYPSVELHIDMLPPDEPQVEGVHSNEKDAVYYHWRIFC